MKMGNIASPWRYDNAAENAIEATLMRCGCGSGCADQWACAERQIWHIMPYSL
jgi:hypothetical protein